MADWRLPGSRNPADCAPFCVISGGTGGNAIASAFAQGPCTYVCSISDDGGSSSEIQRILGGPSVGDLRSRLVRLIPDAAPGSPRFAIRRLLEYRLGDDAPPRSFSHTHAPGEDVRAEWRRILEGTHALWRGIPADRRECIRPFLVNADAALLRRAPASARPFNWHRASVGNLFITGAAQTLGGSIQAAILLFACMADIPHERLRVVPVINTPATATIGVQLADGSVVVGQSEISHPNPKAKDSGESLAVRPDSPFRPTSSRASSRSGAATPFHFEGPILGAEEIDDPVAAADDPLSSAAEGAMSGSGHLLPPSNVFVVKDDDGAHVHAPLPARIARVFYINAYGLETFPKPNTRFVDALSESRTLVYSCGSLFTSIIPCLALRGIGTAVATSARLERKVLVLNTRPDRETLGFGASDFVLAVRDALNARYGNAEGGDEAPAMRHASEYITHVFYLRGSRVPIDAHAVEELGVQLVELRPRSFARDGTPLFDGGVITEGLARISSPKLQTTRVDGSVGDIGDGGVDDDGELGRENGNPFSKTPVVGSPLDGFAGRFAGMSMGAPAR